MLIVPLEQAEPGMRLAVAVTHPDNPTQELLRRNYVLERSVIDRLRDLGIDQIYVDYPGLEDLDKHLAPNLSPERQELYNRMKSTISDVQRDASPSIDYWDYHLATREFVTTLLTNGRNPIYLDQLSTGLGGSGVAHAMAVGHLAMVMGIRMERYLIRQRHRLKTAHAREVVNLGVAGMLHDLGKTRLAPELQPKHELSPHDNDRARADWQAHAWHGYELVRDDVKPTAAAAVLNHHQHFDGSGFPTSDAQGQPIDPQEEQEIHVYARILFAADLYERLATPPDGKGPRRSNLEILHLMRQRYADWLDPEVLAALPRVVPPFPPGGKVTLSDGRVAVVMAIDPESPYRPVVRPLAADGKTLAPETVCLTKRPELTIIEAAGIPVGDKTPPRPKASAA
ncbi:MAG TPA: HD domain-containing phosphohydrolase [Tepidisphaeraceae bacterium]